MTAIVIGEKAAFALVVEAWKRVKARKKFLTALPRVFVRVLHISPFFLVVDNQNTQCPR